MALEVLEPFIFRCKYLKPTRWWVRCSYCKDVFVVTKSRIKIQDHCGCNPGYKIKHGLFRNPSYRIWIGIKERCLNKNHQSFSNYGGRGINLCDRWMKFENFYEDMGDRPPGKSIDRINNDGNYEPTNCRWATAKEQANNTRNNVRHEFNGEKLTLSEWAEKTGIRYLTISKRLYSYGWTLEEALTTSTMSRGNKLKRKYKTKSVG